jgi:signal peptidase II
VLGFALLFAGGVGNLTDRVLHDGAVVDFMNLGIGPVQTGVFNVADLAVTSAVIVMLASALVRRTNSGRAGIGLS